MQKEKFEELKSMVASAIMDFMYYNRKECDIVNLEDIKTITKEQLEELAEVFKLELLMSQ